MKKGYILAEGAIHPRICVNIRRCAFTLAEVLITLGIIGIVAAMTIPTLVANYQTKSWNTSASVFERKLGEALKVMNSEMTLAGQKTTENFVNELSKHIKIAKVCQNDKLMECFSEKVYWGSGDLSPKEIDLTVVKTAKNLGQHDWKTNVVGVQFANGVNALLAYNPSATQDPFSNQIVTFSGDSSSAKTASVKLGTNALVIVYDTSGFKSPNENAKDLRTLNVKNLGTGCVFEKGSTCVTSMASAVVPYKWKGCNSDGTSSDPEDQEVMSKYGIGCIAYGTNGSDYYAGAAIACGGISKLPTFAQAAEISNYVYNTSLITSSGSGGKYFTRNEDRMAELGLSGNPSIWLNEDHNSLMAPYWTFYSRFASSSTSGDRDLLPNHLVLCVN